MVLVHNRRAAGIIGHVVARNKAMFASQECHKTILQPLETQPASAPLWCRQVTQALVCLPAARTA